MNSHGDENWLREILLTKLRVFNNLTCDQLAAKTPLEIQSIIRDPRLEELLLQNITYSPEKRSELTELIRQWNPNVSQPKTNPLEQFDFLMDTLSPISEREFYIGWKEPEKTRAGRRLEGSLSAQAEQLSALLKEKDLL